MDKTTIPQRLKSEHYGFCLVKDKRAIEKDWPNRPLRYDDKKLLDHLQKGGNYGVIGGYGNLVMVDFDDRDIQSQIAKKLPETFTTRSAGKGLLHMYYHTDEARNGVLLKPIPRRKKTELPTAVDIQGKGKYLVGPNSTIESIDKDGKKIVKKYEIVKDIPIAYIPIGDLFAIIFGGGRDQFSKNELFENKEKDVGDKNNPVYTELAKKLPISQYLKEQGMPIDRNPTMCPLGHESNNQRCLSYNDEMGTWNCHHCGYGGNIVHLYLLTTGRGITSRDKMIGVNELCEKYGVEDKYMQELVDPDDCIEIPRDGRTYNEFCKDVAKEMSKVNTLFMEVSSQMIVETIYEPDDKGKMSFKEVKEVTVNRLLNIIEENITFYRMKSKVATKCSLDEKTGRRIICNTNFIKSLRPLRHVLNYQRLFIDDSGELYLCKKGYDPRSMTLVTQDAPDISMDKTVDEFKAMVEDLLGDFCFKTERDKTMAISYMLTPALRGLFSHQSTRTPIFLILANRERAGKDYLAGVVGTIYEGEAVDEPPFSTASKYSNDDEIRKRITSKLLNKSGVRYHSSNNIGFMKSPILDQILTSAVYEDRILGKSSMVKLPNTLDYSLSANMGLKYTPDFFHRCRPIELFFDEEDPNARTFRYPNLHLKVKQERGYILSCIYSAIRQWFYNEMEQKDNTLSREMGKLSENDVSLSREMGKLSENDVSLSREIGKLSENDVSLSREIGKLSENDVSLSRKILNLSENQIKSMCVMKDLSRNDKKLSQNNINLSENDTYLSRNGKKLTPFSSYPEWAKLCGGVMSFHELGDPCVKVSDLDVGGDNATKSMRKLYELCYKKQESAKKGISQVSDGDAFSDGGDDVSERGKYGFTISEIREIIIEEDDEELFADYDLEFRTGQTKFGILFKTHLGRFHGGIRVKIGKEDTNSRRTRYSFTKN